MRPQTNVLCMIVVQEGVVRGSTGYLERWSLVGQGGPLVHDDERSLKSRRQARRWIGFGFRTVIPVLLFSLRTSPNSCVCPGQTRNDTLYAHLLYPRTSFKSPPAPSGGAPACCRLSITSCEQRTPDGRLARIPLPRFINCMIAWHDGPECSRPDLPPGWAARSVPLNSTLRVAVDGHHLDF